MDKSKRIQFLGNQLKNNDRDIEAAKKIMTLPATKINMSNASGESCDISIWSQLKKPLSDFLIEYFNEEKRKTYEELKNELK